MMSGYLLRDVVNKVNGIHFLAKEELFTLGHLYETMLREMRDAAGENGEFYTPRPVVRFMVDVTDPKLGETVLDPACGTGGFLVEAYQHLEQQCQTVEDRRTLQEHSFYGGEAKPLPYLLCQMNLLLHGLEAPQIDPGNSLRFKLTEIGDRDRVDVILTNPPFGGEEEAGIKGNFPERHADRARRRCSSCSSSCGSCGAAPALAPRPRRSPPRQGCSREWMSSCPSLGPHVWSDAPAARPFRPWLRVHLPVGGQGGDAVVPAVGARHGDRLQPVGGQRQRDAGRGHHAGAGAGGGLAGGLRRGRSRWPSASAASPPCCTRRRTIAPQARAAVEGATAVCEIEQGLPCVTGDERADRAAVRPGFLAVLRSRDILLLGLAAMFLCMVEFAALAHLVLYLRVGWVYSTVAAGGLLAVCQAAGAVGKPLSGLVSDRLLGRRRRAPLVALALLAALACALLALLRPGQTGLLWLALLMLGIGAVGWGGLFGTLAGETAGPATAGAAAGVTAAIDNIGIFLGPLLFGLIVDRTGSYTPAWWTMVGAALIAAVLVALIRERRHA